MKNLKPICLALALSTATLTTQAAEPITIQEQKQVAGYYQYEAGDVQITTVI